MFQILKTKGKIDEKEIKYFAYEYEKTCNLGKLYLLPKIHKRLPDVVGRPVISNCGTPNEKMSEFFDRQLKPIMQKSSSYIKDSGDFIRKLKTLIDISEGSILITAEMVGLYPSITHKAGLKALKKALDERQNTFISTKDIVKMAEFVLKNNYFQFDCKAKQQTSGTAIGTKFAPTYACLFTDQIETDFLRAQENVPFVWFRYIDDVFFT